MKKFLLIVAIFFMTHVSFAQTAPNPEKVDVQKDYYPTGELRSEMNTTTGATRSYSKNGKISHEESVDKESGKKIKRFYYENGVSVEFVLKGEEIEIYKRYRQDGTVDFYIKDGVVFDKDDKPYNGILKRYDDVGTGNLLSESNMKDGKRNGFEKSNYKTGIVITQYIDGKLVADENGFEKIYDESGNVIGKGNQLLDEDKMYKSIK